MCILWTIAGNFQSTIILSFFLYFNSSQGSCQQLTLYPYDKKVAKVLIVNNICLEFKETGMK